MSLTNKGNYKDIYRELLVKLVKEKSDEIKDLAYEINQDYLKYYFFITLLKKDFMISIIVYNFFQKMQSGEIRLEEAKTQQNIFKSNSDEISRE